MGGYAETRSVAFDTYNWYDIFDREKTFPEVEVRRGVKGTTALTLNLPSEKQTFLMLLRADEKPDIRYEYPTELEAPVHEGQEVGRHPTILMTSRWLLIRSMRQKQWRRLIMGGV